MSAALNYYKHHLGDYAKKTGHLSLLEHGAYLLMLHAYYGTEKPLPSGEHLYRMARAHTKAERAAVDSIARQFWKKTESGLVNGRAFDELEDATRLAEIAKANGNHGGRPRKTQRVSETEPTGKAIQTPDSNIQNPIPTHSDSRTPKTNPKSCVGDWKPLKTADELEAEEAAHAGH